MAVVWSFGVCLLMLLSTAGHTQGPTPSGIAEGGTACIYPGENGPELHSILRYRRAALSATDILDAWGQYRELDLLSSSVMNFGSIDDGVVVFWSLENCGDSPGSWTFYSGRNSLPYAHLFEIRDGKLQDRVTLDDSNEVKHVLQTYQSLAFEFDLVPGEKTTLGMAYISESTSQLTPGVFTQAEMQKENTRRLSVFLVTVTATLTLILVNGVLLLITRKKILFLVIASEFVLMYQGVHLQGYTTNYLWYFDFDFSRLTGGIARTLFCVFSFRFAQQFLNLRATAPWLNNILNAGILYGLMPLVLGLVYLITPFNPVKLANNMSFPLAAFAMILLPLVAIRATVQEGITHLPLAISWGIFGAFGVYYILAGTASFVNLPFDWSWFSIMCFFEALFLSLAVGMHFREIMERERLVQTELSDSLTRQLALSRQAEKSARERVVAAQELDERGHLMVSVGHDCRSLLAALEGLGQRLVKNPSLKGAGEIGKNISEIAMTISNTLAMAVAGTRGHSLSGDAPCFERVDAKSLLETVKYIYDAGAAEKKATIRIKSNVAQFACDRTLITRVLSNLVDNAIKYGGAGKVLMICKRIDDSILFRVFDQGQGFPKTVLDVVRQDQFGKMRGDTDQEGAGIGLAVVSDIVHRLGGRLEILSRPGRGACVSVILPEADIRSLPAPHLHVLSDVPELRKLEGIVPQISLTTEEEEFLSRQAVSDSSQEAVLVFDPVTLSPKEQSLIRRVRARKIAVSFDKSADFRSNWCAVADVVIFRPVDLEALLAGLAYIDRISSDSGAQSVSKS